MVSGTSGLTRANGFGLREVLDTPRRNYWAIRNRNLTPPQTSFRMDLLQARSSYFSLERTLVHRPLKIGWTMGLVFSLGLSMEYLLGISASLDGLSFLGAGKALQEKEPDLLEKLVASSQGIEASFIAKELVKRGANNLNKKFLTGLREADGTKYNQVVALMQSRRLRAMNIVKKIVTGAAHWTAFAIYKSLDDIIALLGG